MLVKNRFTGEELGLFEIKRGADLSGADLRGADLRGADLSGADLREADLSGADLSGADLREANLRGADLSGADLSGADLRRAKIADAKNASETIARTIIVPAGELVGWKKCNEGSVKLLIPSDAKRSNATGRKCRAEFVKDVAHFTFAGEETDAVFTSKHSSDFKYVIGQIIKCDTWNENRFAECGGGIHFFITREEAEAY